MVIKKIMDLFKKDSHKATVKSKISHSDSARMKSHKELKADERKDDWASRSGVYNKLSDSQKKYLDKVGKIIDKELKD